MKSPHVVFFAVLIGTISAPFLALSFQIRAIEGLVRNDFALSPAKVELSIAPGETVAKTLTISNRHAKTLDFAVSVEDISGSDNPEEAVVIGGEGNGDGIYSLRDFLKPEVSFFRLGPNEEITFAVGISIPEDAPPGGRYGSVLISSASQESGGSGAVAISRLAALFFVRVGGEAREEGKLEDFRLREDAANPLRFEIFYKNTGNVHLIPYGRIDIKNMFGRSADSLILLPYFALPNSTRYQEIAWNDEVLPGRYSAALLLNRGYGNIVDEKIISFWILPEERLWWLAGALLILALLWNKNKR